MGIAHLTNVFSIIILGNKILRPRKPMHSPPYDNVSYLLP
ncbi:hypothetical protein cce_2749 [Crocosphaera subtropica ATCC 51142]|uniref:Uncharacterized protein n=1 Tax=Crocosphaera subtropica (strain ATCC 51142 / BH68) TaxID=43989 RepID=B1WU35_CROS5|nr:hypothetical protein cce_2749 [Crocosphaera subtropica ATCC 51142]